MTEEELKETPAFNGSFQVLRLLPIDLLLLTWEDPSLFLSLEACEPSVVSEASPWHLKKRLFHY